MLNTIETWFLMAQIILIGIAMICVIKEPKLVAFERRVVLAARKAVKRIVHFTTSEYYYQ